MAFSPRLGNDLKDLNDKEGNPPLCARPFGRLGRFGRFCPFPLARSCYSADFFGALGMMGADAPK